MLQKIKAITAKPFQPYFVSKINSDKPENAINLAIFLSKYLFNDNLLNKYIGYREMRPKDPTLRLQAFEKIYDNGFRKEVNSKRCMCIVAYTYQSIMTEDEAQIHKTKKYLDSALEIASKLPEKVEYKSGYYYCLLSLYHAYLHRSLYLNNYDETDDILNKSVNLIRGNIEKIKPRRAWVSSVQGLGILALHLLRNNWKYIEHNDLVDIRNINDALIGKYCSLMFRSKNIDHVNEKRISIRFGLMVSKLPKDENDISLYVSNNYMYYMLLKSFLRLPLYNNYENKLKKYLNYYSDKKHITHKAEEVYNK